MAAKKTGDAERLIGLLKASKKEQALLWHRYVVEGRYEEAHHRKPTQRDVDMEIRHRMENEDPEIIRWRLSLLLGPLKHGAVED